MPRNPSRFQSIPLFFRVDEYNHWHDGCAPQEALLKMWSASTPSREPRTYVVFPGATSYSLGEQLKLRVPIFSSWHLVAPLPRGKKR